MKLYSWTLENKNKFYTGITLLVLIVVVLLELKFLSEFAETILAFALVYYLKIGLRFVNAKKILKNEVLVNQIKVS